MYQDSVMVPVGDWAKERLAKLSETDKVRDESKVGSGFGKNISNCLVPTLRVGTKKDAERPALHSHAERANE